MAAPAPDCCRRSTWNSTTAFGKVKGGVSCKAVVVPAAGVRNSKGKKLDLAETSRRNAVSLLQSCLNLFKHVTISIEHGNDGKLERGRWEDFCDHPDSKIRFQDLRYAFLTPSHIKQLLDIMTKITFMEDNSEQNAQIFAYVFPTTAQDDPRYRKVFLCNKFWLASDDLERDSKIGTLIHVVSHLLGAEDIPYARRIENDLFELTNVDHRTAKSAENSTCKFVSYLGELSVWNANNVEYEFELDLCHTKQYDDGQWNCCGATERFSVCNHRMHAFTPIEALRVDGEVLTLKSFRLSCEWRIRDHLEL